MAQRGAPAKVAVNIELLGAFGPQPLALCMAYRSLRADCVVETIDTLERRIGARLPESGLRMVCATLAATARRCAAEAERLSRPATLIRLSVYAVWAAGAAAALWLLAVVRYEEMDLGAANVVQALEAAMNLAVLVGLGVVGLGRLEDRWKRRRALDYLHELRSIAHVIDMHQLTKDPYRPQLAPTPHSPKEQLPTALLERYLDYCAEMAALTGKLAALLAQSCRDPAVAGAASDVEALTTGLSQKVWQKMTILARLEEAAPR